MFREKKYCIFFIVMSDHSVKSGQWDYIRIIIFNIKYLRNGILKKNIRYNIYLKKSINFANICLTHTMN